MASRSPKILEFEDIHDEVVVDQIRENLEFLSRMFALPMPIVAILLIGFAAGSDTIPIFEIDIPTNLIGNVVVIVLIFLIIQAFIATKLIKDIYTKSDEPELIEFILKTHASIFNPYRDGLFVGLMPIVAQGLVFALVIVAAGNHYGWYGDGLDLGNLCNLSSSNPATQIVINNILEAVLFSTCGTGPDVSFEPASILLSAVFLGVILFYGVTFLIFALTMRHAKFDGGRHINSPGLALAKIGLFMVIVLGAFFPQTILKLASGLFG